MLWFDKAAYLFSMLKFILSEKMSIVCEDQIFYYSQNSQI